MRKMTGVMLEDMTWVEIRDAIAAGKRSAVLAVASMEQHGPALPIKTDAMLGRGMGRALALELGDALVAPVVYPGCSGHHETWPGTLSLSAELLGELVGAFVEGLARSGFEEIVLFPSHGGNFEPLREMLPGIRGRAGNAEVVDLLDFGSLLDTWFEVIERHGWTDRTPPHADIIETSIVMYLEPEAVRVEMMEAGFVGTPDLGELLDRGLAAFTDNGVLGDPRGATPQLGEELIDAWVCVAAEEIRRRREERSEF
ncbi:MAG: creatininase family protein [Bacillota bacterium]